MRQIGFPALVVLSACMLTASGTGAQHEAATPGAATQTAEALREAAMKAQERCLKYVAPAEQVVYSEEPEFVKAQRGGEGGYQLVGVMSPVKYEYVQILVKEVVDLELTLRQVHPKFGNLFPSNALPVVHGLTSPSGERFLVTMAVIGTEQDPKMRFAAVTLSVKAGEAPEAASIYKQVVEVPVAYNGRAANKALQLYSGQYDEKDAASFTIRYTSGGEKGTLRGRMKVEDQFPKLVVEVVDGPLKKQ